MLPMMKVASKISLVQNSVMVVGVLVYAN